MFNLFKKEEELEKNNISVISLASLLIHAARIDESYTENESKIIRETLIKLGANNNDIDDIIKKAEDLEKDSNQILDFTREIKTISNEEKEIIIEALWNIIYSDKDADMYETNLMRRLSGLLYLNKKVVGEIKEKVKSKLEK